MKVVKFLSGFILILSLMITGCTEDYDVEEETLSIDQIIEKGYEAYKQEFPYPTIEYVTLEEMNEIHIAHGLMPLTEADFTESEWAQLNDPTLNAHARCTSGLTVWFGDFNQNGTFSTLDKVEAQRVIQGVPPGTGFSPVELNSPPHVVKFGYFDYAYRSYHGGSYDAWFLDFDDLDVAHKVLLGIYPCL